MDSRKDKLVTRRNFLKVAGLSVGLMAAAPLLQACSSGGGAPAAAPTSAPAAAPTQAAAAAPTEAAPAPTQPSQASTATGKVTFMMNPGPEITEAEVKMWNDAHPNWKLEVQTPDFAKLIAATAAGTPTDVYRVQAPDVPAFIVRKMVMDLTDRFNTSKLIKMDDLADANKNYWIDEHFKAGQGKIYGMVKDWSPDLTLFINTNMFKEAGIPVPEELHTYTYKEVHEMALKLTKKSGDKVTVVGVGGASGSWFDRVCEVMMNEQGKSLWAEDFSSISLTNPDSKAVMDYWFTLQDARATYSPVNPVTDWEGPAFQKEQLAICQYGYWYSSMPDDPKDSKARGHVLMLPAPTNGDKHSSPTITATGSVVHSKTKIPDVAWELFEWYSAGQPAKDRAVLGWGVPALKSLYPLMPQETEYQKMVQRCLQHELKMSATYVRFCPYVNAGEQFGNTFVSSYNKHVEAALKKQITFDEMLQNVEKEINAVVKDAIANA